ncbi:hypothetical protein AWB90_16080 [Mycobacterium paraense]|uniref:Uncharacterized protein n=3 Tax=Mycobacterium paraense TaxID=767916 RepID=A0A1X2A837_9MYCO|nr:PecA family PE domain-processing aspartic protease [Mycobacterium paraense]ORW44053.1 hypothetical protein AWB90_16080 [Mycobacterium paraense]
MSFVIAVPEIVTGAATDLASLGSAIDAAHAAAATRTTGVMAAAGDEVSAAIAALFSRQGSAYQALGAQAAAFHAQLVQTLNAGAGAYAAAEASNAAPLQALEDGALGVINAPTELLLGRPLIGNGVNGITDAAGVGTPGGAGGLLWGRGGNGGNSTAEGVPGGAGGPAGLLGTGGTGGQGGWGAPGGAGGTGGFLLGNGGEGGVGGPSGIGGPGGRALLFGNGGPGGVGGEVAVGGAGGAGGLLVGNGGPGGTGGVLAAGGQGGPRGLVFGQAGPGGAYGGDASVELTMINGRPTVAVSVGNGPSVPALIDTGSTATLFPVQDVDLQSLGQATGSGVYKFGPPEQSTVDYYTTYTASLDFGNGIITKPMTVGVITSETYNGVPQTPSEIVLGVGSNTPSLPHFAVSPVQELPGALSQGVLINEPKLQVEFGPDPLTPFAAATGAPITNDLGVAVTPPGGPLGGMQSATGAFVDTGGNGGDLPQSMLPQSLSYLQPGQYLPQGTEIQVEVPSATLSGYQLVYEEIVPANSMLVTAGDFNTGNYVFTKLPVYLSYTPSGPGTMFFDTPA